MREREEVAAVAQQELAFVKQACRRVSVLALCDVPPRAVLTIEQR